MSFFCIFISSITSKQEEINISTLNQKEIGQTHQLFSLSTAIADLPQVVPIWFHHHYPIVASRYLFIFSKKFFHLSNTQHIVVNS